MTDKKLPNADKMTFELAADELDAIVKRIGDGESVDDVLAYVATLAAGAHRA